MPVFKLSQSINKLSSKLSSSTSSKPSPQLSLSQTPPETSSLESNLPITNDLCNVCADLNISAHKFDRNDLSMAGSRGFDDKGLEATNIGFLDEFYGRRDSCPFCRLVYEATHQDDGQGVGHDGLDRDGRRLPCWLDWQLDGRYLAQSHVNQQPASRSFTRRLRLYSKTNAFQPCYLVRLRQEHDIQSPSFHARTVEPEQANMQQLRTWLNLCEKNHKQCSLAPNAKSGIPSKLRVIDVSVMSIVDIDSAQRYCALSYCWGRAPSFMLKTENYLALQKKNGVVEDLLPQTVRHALRLVAALGERYIWVDALCIIQDDQKDWAEIAPLMDRIYGLSILTICAASGASSDYGLPGCQPGSRSLVQTVRNCGGLELLPSRTLEDRIELSPWNSRAWTFQERMLSRKCLIFVDDRVFFQCREVTWSEDLDCESAESFWTLDAIRSPLSLFKENPLRCYSKFIELYSGRYLTYQSDRLMAFEGIAQSLAPGFGPTTSIPFHYGMPAWYFDWALLWELRTSGKRVDKPEREGTIFPSWSWSGWQGASEWRMSTTSSLLLNLHEWLMLHTWIIWYIGRDDHHQLVYQTEQTYATPVQGRWAGYPPRNMGLDLYGRTLQRHASLPFEPTHAPQTGRLHFFTWSAFFKLSRESMSSDSFKSNLQPGLHRFSITDYRNDWCGTMILDESYFNHVDATFEFIAISDARDFAMEEYDSWTYYIPGERGESEWYLYYALMIRWNTDKTVAERLGLAKIYKTAFETGSFQPGFEWKEITLG